MSTNTPRDALARLTDAINQLQKTSPAWQTIRLPYLLTLCLDLLGRLVDELERLENERTK
jgi:hypothetical protein